MIEQEIRTLSEKYMNRVIELRRDFHMHPELGLNEFRTAGIVQEELEKLGMEVITGVAETGVIGILKGDHPGKTVMLRADMDALPIEEDTGLSYQSVEKGVMHACGHDGHTASLLGVAMILSEMKHLIHGTIKFLFQPSEEYNDASIMVVEAGALKNPDVDYALGLHLWGSVEKGKVAVRKGPIMASPCIFKFRVKGKGGHGALPHTTIDSISIAVCAINDITFALSRKLSPFDNSIVSFCSIHGGTEYNIIPEYVDVVGTVRTFNKKLTDEISTLMEQVLAGVVRGHGGEYDFRFTSTIPPVVNDAAVTEIVKTAAEKIAGEQMVYELADPDMGGEDFSIYAELVPSSFFFVGISDDLEKPVIHHNSKFAWNDDVLKTCMDVMAMAALNVLESAGRLCPNSFGLENAD